MQPLKHPVNEFELLGTASWDLDIWGKIRRTVESDNAVSEWRISLAPDGTIAGSSFSARRERSES